MKEKPYVNYDVIHRPIVPLVAKDFILPEEEMVSLIIFSRLFFVLKSRVCQTKSSAF